MTANPYASPETAPKRITKKQIKAQAWLNGAGLALLLLGLAHMLLSPLLLLAGVGVLIRMSEATEERRDADSAATAITFIVVSIPCFARAAIMFLGGIHIRSKQRYRWAKAGAIATLCGILFPLLWLDVPFGIWAYLLLRKDKYKAMFEFGPATKPAAIQSTNFAEPS